MSGPLRKKLAPTIARLKRYIETSVTDIPLNQKIPDDEEQTAELLDLILDHKSKITACIKQIETTVDKWTAFISHLPKAERTAENTEFDTFDDKTLLSATLDEARDRIETLITLARAASNGDEEDSIETDDKTHEDDANPKNPTSTYKIRQDIIKLPNIQIKSFYGDPLEWAAFIEAFLAVIDSQPLPPVVKLNYLIGYLEGAAKKAIQGYRVVGENYSIVMDVLKTRFGNEDMIKQSLHTELDNLTPAVEGKVQSLREVLEAVNRIIRQLEAHGEVIDHPHIYTAIMKKLPKSVFKLLLAEKERSTEWNFQKIEEELQRIVSLQEAVDRAYAENHVLPKNLYQPIVNATVMSAHRQPKTPCSFCSKMHWTQECRTYATDDARQHRIRELRLCFRCLKTGHTAKECTHPLTCRNCRKSHPSALCRQKSINDGPPRTYTSNMPQRQTRAQPIQYRQEKQKYVNRQLQQTPRPIQPAHQRQVHFATTDDTPATGANATPLGPSHTMTTSSDTKDNTQAMLLTITVQTVNPHQSEKSAELIALFDTGADYSYISDAAIEQLNIQTRHAESLPLFTFGNDNPQIVESRHCEIQVISPIGAHTLAVKSMPYLTHNVQTLALNSDTPVVTRIKPDILIGNNYFWEFIRGNPKKLKHGFYELETVFGPLLCGQPTKNAIDNFEKTVNSVVFDDDEKMPDLEKFWSLEGIGITDDIHTSDDEKAIKFFYETVARAPDGRYIVRWPFKEDPSTLDSNYGLTFKRLQQTLHRVKKAEDQSLPKQYDGVIVGQIDNSMVEDVTLKTPVGQYFHYLPHHPVFTPDKETTKLRLVYNGSAKTKNGKSLNDYLLRGPVLLPDLCGTLLRFRLPEIAIVADVEKAFLQVQLHPLDRDLTRFLWVKDYTKPLTEDNIRILRFTRIPFGIISSPGLLALVIKYHLEHYPNQSSLIIELLLNMYVDNAFFSASSIEEGISRFHEAKEIFSDAQLNLRGFISNSPELNEYYAKHEKAVIPTLTKMLGLQWELVPDMLFLVLPKFELDNPFRLTKRMIIRHIAKAYDPLGILAPATLHAKIFSQYLWKEEYDWDERLANRDMQEWQNIISNWDQRFAFRRRINCGTKPELHVFVDASELAYAAVAYLVTRHPDGTVTSEIIFSKNRLAPMKQPSIPRLELMAILIGTKLITYLIRELSNLQFSSINLWSDSKCALQWVISNNDKTIFVANRVRQIQACKDVLYRYISTDENPADHATKGLHYPELVNKEIWFHGPTKLRYPETWPPGLKPMDTLNLEPEFDATTLSSHAAVNNESTYRSTIDVSRFSKWNRLIHAMMMIIQFLSLMCSKCETTADIQWPSAPNTKRQKAIVFLIKEAQKRHPLSEKEQRKYNMYLDDNGLWCCQHRLSNNSLFNSKPYFLPRHDHLTRIIVMNLHEQLQHAGTNATLAAVQQQYTIPKCRQTVKMILKKHCMLCRKHYAKPFLQPNMPQLPAERINRERPFYYTGLDFFGPLWIKTSTEHQKAWILLLTCFCTRAVHFELVPDMTTDSFLRAFRRFTSRRGRPNQLLSDNAKQFHLASELFQGEVQRIQSTLTDKNITWKFIPELSPWFGGLYERLVGIAKTSLKKAIGKKILTYDELTTVLCEAEAIVNSRPLTYVAPDNNMESTVLKPCNFLTPLDITSSATTTDLELDDDDWNPEHSTAILLLNKWKIQQSILEKFWQLWSTEYLTMLKTRTQIKHAAPHAVQQSIPRLNEIVLISSELAPRNVWPLAKIVELPESSPIRIAKVQTANGNILTRPVSKLYSLEIPCDDVTLPKIPSTKESSPDTTTAEKRTHTETKDDYDGPAKRTRSRCRATTSLYAVTIMLLLQLIGVQGQNGKCQNVSETLALIAQQECVETGIRIMQYSNGNYCWDTTTCKDGHMRLSKTSSCGPKCYCPTWADNCSFYNGSLTSISKVTNPSLKDALKNYVVPGCSSAMDKNCSTQHTNAFKVALFDNTELIIKKLHLSTSDVARDDKLNPTCIGKGTITGSSKYCAIHSCATTGTQFCYYSNPPLTTVILDDLHIPIKAWGPYLMTNTEEDTNSTTVSCPTCQAQCATGGVKINSPIQLSPVEICAQARCLQMLSTDNDEILLLPHSIQLYDHEIRVTAWHHGHQVLQQQLFCSAAPICELITCMLCIERIRNLNCTPTMSTIIISIAIISLLLIIPIFIGILCCLLKTTFKTKNIIHSAWKFGWVKSKGARNLPAFSNRRKRRVTKSAAAITLITLLSALLPCVESCGVETTSFNSKSHNCIQNQNGTLTCSFSETTVLSVLPQGQKTCLLLRDHKGSPVGTLILQMISLNAKCNRKTEFFTRDHKYETRSSKRCSSQGACSGSKCENVKPTDSSSEFSSEINKAPGHLFCEASCGCWGCNCFICSSACLFYKVYALPTTSTVYEIFSCPTYTTTVKLKAFMNLGTKNDQKELELQDTALEWNQFKFDIIAKSIPPLPVLASRFLQNLNDRTTRTIGTSNPGQPQPGTVGQLQCTSWQNAQSFNCFFPVSICKCSNADNSANCVCPSMDHSSLITSASSQEKLPIIAGEAMLQHEAGQVFVKLTAKIQIQVTTNNLTVAVKSSINSCNGTISKITGCYNCLLGAKTTVRCFTDFGVALAKIKCSTTTGTTLYDGAIHCNSSGSYNNITILTTMHTLDGHCALTCPGGGVDIKLQTAELISLETESMAANYTISNVKEDQHQSEEIHLPSWTDIFEGYTNFMSTMISSIFSGIFALPFLFKVILLLLFVIVIYIIVKGGVCRLI